MQTKQRVLTGITTTGVPHLGNYLGALKPAIAASQSDQYDGFYFLADYHALIKCQDPQVLHRSTQEIAAIWLALGLNTDKVTFYRQSDIVEIPQLCWLLNCMTAKGLMNRSHAYKAAIDDNLQQGDHDQGISMGLFSYPILMAADILLFNAHYIPVGKDQIQHIEMCRDIAARFNKVYQPLFNLPQAMVAHGEPKILSGLDGRKMSKSYGNIIPLFAPSDQLRKLINQITTNSLKPGQPKDPDTCTLFEIYNAFATSTAVEQMRQRYANGIGWGQMKQELFEYLDTYLSPARQRFEHIIQDPQYIETQLQQGAIKARQYSQPFMAQLRAAVGITALDKTLATPREKNVVKEAKSGNENSSILAGRQKAIAIAHQREAEQMAQVQAELDQLLAAIKNASDPQAAYAAQIQKLQQAITYATNKQSKLLRKKLQLLQAVVL